MYMPIKLSELMLNPLCCNPCRVIFVPCSWHAITMWILWSLWVQPTLTGTHKKLFSTSLVAYFWKKADQDEKQFLQKHFFNKKFEMSAFAVSWLDNDSAVFHPSPRTSSLLITIDHKRAPTLHSKTNEFYCSEATTQNETNNILTAL